VDARLQNPSIRLLSRFNKGESLSPHAIKILIPQSSSGTIMKTSSVVCLLALGVASQAFAQSKSCEELAKLEWPDMKVTLAQVVQPGAFTPPAGGPGPVREPSPVFKTLPAFCRVAVTLTPTADSEIRSEIWLPVSGWSSKFQVVGNGGWAGNLSYPNMAEALAAGYATASTDTGHANDGSPNASFAYHHPEKMLDFGWRALHETTVTGKSLIKTFYGTATQESIYNGCSTGGRQGLNAVQKFPMDFDGAIVGAPVNPMTRLHAGSLYNSIFAHKDPANYIPPEKYPMIHKAVVDACDALDGVKDGLIENPMACHWSPKVLQCKGADSSSCLTSSQVEMVNTIYGGAINPRTKEQVFPGWERGSEMGFRVTAGPEPEGPAIGTFRYVVFQDPNWDWHTLSYDQDIALADRMGAAQIDAIATDLSPFFTHGGKLLMFHGWADPNVAPRNTVNYYNKVLQTMGGEAKVRDSIRLFMAPGMGHCGGGEGPNAFDRVGTMEQWLSTGKAPTQMIASHITGGKVDRTRPLCPYPQVARYKGSGSIDEAANFSCVAPGK
jgi:Tannase and feruloyl esterase